jgi:hypothetical protein
MLTQNGCKKKGLKIGYLNIRYLHNKMNEIPYILSKTNDGFHVFCIAETHLDKKLEYPELAMKGYEKINKPASKPLETGLLVYHTPNMHITRQENFENMGVESIWLEITLKKTKPLFVGFIYRNPCENANWFNRFSTMMETVSRNGNEIILSGDLNINLLQPHNTWKKTYKQFNLFQILKRPTRKVNKTETLIDHIYTTDKTNIIEATSSNFGPSDHDAICTTWSKKNIKIPKIGHTTTQYRNMSKFNQNNFLNDLQHVNLSLVYQFPEPDEALSFWTNTFNKIYSKHAPLQTKRVKDQLSKDWFNKDVAEAIRDRENCNKNDPNFNTLRNKVTSIKRSAIKQHINGLIENNAKSKTLWSAVDCATNKKIAKRPQPITLINADELNKHFNEVPRKTVVHDLTSNNNLSKLEAHCQEKKIDESATIPFLSVAEVYDYLRNLKQSNTRGLDNIDSKILKLSAPIIADSLTFIYNQCIAKNYFPLMLKQSKIVPLHKSGDKKDPSNYRPISLLPILSKPLEKHIEKHIQAHITKYNLLHENQSGFRKNHSCHTALTNMIEQFYTNLNDEQLTGVIFADFAKAFDVIDHKILLRKLEIYNLSPSLITFIQSFLENRQHLVSINQTNSEYLQQKYGVPQGSILGPLLFSLYINDLPLHISNSSCEMFADDTSLHAKDPNIDTLTKKLQKTLDQMVSWSELNHMALNSKKTKCMLITTPQKRNHLTKSSLQLFVKNDQIQDVDEHVILGVTIQNNLSWGNYLEDLSSKVSSKLHLLNRIKPFLNTTCRKLFFHAYIQSIIDYASTLWDQSPKSDTNPLTNLHNRAIKITLNKSSLDGQDYRDSGILPLKHKLMLNKGVFMHKIINKNAPAPLIKKFPKNNNRNYHNDIEVCHPRIETFKKSLQYSGSTLWNSLPDYLRHTKILNAFRCNYKRNLFARL